MISLERTRRTTLLRGAVVAFGLLLVLAAILALGAAGASSLQFTKSFRPNFVRFGCSHTVETSTVTETVTVVETVTVSCETSTAVRR